MIELLYGDGRIARIDRLTKSDYPGITNINSFMCAGGSQRLLAATDCGFLEIDAASGAPGDLHFSSRPLSAVFDVEGRLVALTLDGLMSGDTDPREESETFEPDSKFIHQRHPQPFTGIFSMRRR